MSEKLTLFDRFGGTRKMADVLGEASSTVHSWKAEGRIPAKHQPKVLEKARELGIDINAEDVVFPMGREDAQDEASRSPDNGAEIIGGADGEAARGHPFEPPSSPTCSPTSALRQPPAASPASSAGELSEAAE